MEFVYDRSAQDVLQRTKKKYTLTIMQPTYNVSLFLTRHTVDTNPVVVSSPIFSRRTLMQ